MTAAVVMVAAATVVTAGMAFAVVVMVIAADIGVKAQIAGQEISNSCIGIACAATVKLDASLCQCHLGTAADTAADQYVCMEAVQQACQGTVTAAVGIDHFRRYNGIVFYFVNLELLGVTEVLEDHTVSVSNCDSHDSFAPLLKYHYYNAKFSFVKSASRARSWVCSREVSALP